MLRAAAVAMLLSRVAAFSLSQQLRARPLSRLACRTTVRCSAATDTAAPAGGRASAAVAQQEDAAGAPRAAPPAAPLELTPPKGTRDFYPADQRLRAWLFAHWRAVGDGFGFEEYDAPVLENEALYVRKAGEEVTEQLYCFEDKGGRRVALRPEMTPSLARMVMARAAALPAPIKWYSLPQCWRYERMTRGRRREHFQWNMDVWGVAGVEAEAELLAAAVAFLERVGLTAADVGVRVSSRAVLAEVLAAVGAAPAAADAPTFAKVCVLVDKLEKQPLEGLLAEFDALGVDEPTARRLADALGARSLDALEAVLGPEAAAGSAALAQLRTLFALAEGYGFADWLVLDASVVRGLACVVAAPRPRRAPRSLGRLRVASSSSSSRAARVLS